MLRYAEKIADALDMRFPDGVEDSFDACRDFIDKYAVKVPPTEKQVKFAQTLAKDAGVSIPREVLDSKLELSKWIDAHSGNGED
jgi:DNA topoisomerase-3